VYDWIEREQEAEEHALAGSARGLRPMRVADQRSAIRDQ